VATAARREAERKVSTATVSEPVSWGAKVVVQSRKEAGSLRESRRAARGVRRVRARVSHAARCQRGETSEV